MACPAGSYCPNAGMNFTLPCPSGFICNQTSIVEPTVLCPAGYVCESGTSSFVAQTNYTYNSTVQLCPPAAFCLTGTGYNSTLYAIFNHPQPCIAGTYCSGGASDFSGTAICPAGDFCPTGVSQPKEVDIGSYSGGSAVDSGAGAIDETLCAPGTFTATVASQSCSQCPAGYTCSSFGTSTPNVCPAGDFRALSDSVSCKQCPQGFYSPHTGLSDASFCLPCPQGYVCPVAGGDGLQSAHLCVDGYVCGEQTTTATQLDHPCPQGFVCPQGCIPSTQYNQPCQAGYVCDAGTATYNEHTNACPIAAYCPPGTSHIALDDIGTLQLVASPSGTTTPALYINCPPSNTLGYEPTTLEPCGHNIYTLLMPDGFTYFNRSTGQCPYGTTTTVSATAYDQCVPITAQKVLYEYSPLNRSKIDTSSLPVIYNTADPGAFDMQITPLAYLTLAIDLTKVPLTLTYNNTWLLNVYSNGGTPQLLPIGFAENIVDLNYRSPTQFGVMSLGNPGSNYDMSPMNVSVTAAIIDGKYLSGIYSFVDIGTVKVKQPERATVGTNSFFLAIYPFSTTFLVKPMNLVRPDEISNGMVIESTTLTASVPLLVEAQSTINQASADIPYNTYTLPYLPYFSDCRGFDSYMPLHVITESTDYCTVVSPEDTIYVGSLSLATSPVSDTCQVVTECLFEEDLTQSTTQPRWFDKAADQQPMFYITSRPLSYDSWADVGFADSSGVYTQLVASADPSMIRCIINRDQNAPSDAVPRTVDFQLNYQQLDSYSKQIISCAITLSDFDVDITTLNYNLTFSYQPLSYFGLINRFAFSLGVFAIIFAAVGMIGLGISLMYYTIHRTSRAISTAINKAPAINYPVFRIKSWLIYFLPTVTIGILLAGLPIGAVIYFIGWLLRDNPQTKQWFNAQSASFNDLGTLNAISAENALLWQAGRIGTALCAFGLYCMFVGTNLLIPPRRKQLLLLRQSTLNDSTRTNALDIPLRYGNTWKPKHWQRYSYMTLLCVTACVATFLIELSFAPFFNVYTYEIMIGMKFLELPVELLGMSLVRESMLYSPVAMIIEMSQFLVTMSATDFTNFVLCYCIDYGAKYPERVWVQQARESGGELFGHIFYRIRYVLATPQQRVTMENHAAKKAYRPILQVLNDHNMADDEVAGVLENTSEYTTKLLAFLTTPAIMYVIKYFEVETQLLLNYVISDHDYTYYIVFAVTIIPFMLIVDCMHQNILEVQWRWHLYDYCIYLRHIYNQRIERWQLSNPYGDRSVPTVHRRVAQLAFSSQYYFVILVPSIGVLMCVLAMQVFIHKPFNPFADPMTPLIAVIMWTVCWLLSKICLLVADLCGLWHPLKPTRIRTWKAEEYRSDLGVIPLWSQQYRNAVKKTQQVQLVEKHRLTHQAFRDKFVVLNRLYLLDHLASVFSPTNIKHTLRDVMYNSEQWMTDFRVALGLKADSKPRKKSVKLIAKDTQHSKKPKGNKDKKRGLSVAALRLKRLSTAPRRADMDISSDTPVSGISSDSGSTSAHSSSSHDDAHDVRLAAEAKRKLRMIFGNGTTDRQNAVSIMQPSMATTVISQTHSPRPLSTQRSEREAAPELHALRTYLPIVAQLWLRVARLRLLLREVQRTVEQHQITVVQPYCQQCGVRSDGDAADPLLHAVPIAADAELLIDNYIQQHLQNTDSEVNEAEWKRYLQQYQTYVTYCQQCHHGGNQQPQPAVALRPVLDISSDSDSDMDDRVPSIAKVNAGHPRLDISSDSASEAEQSVHTIDSADEQISRQHSALVTPAAEDSNHHEIEHSPNETSLDRMIESGQSNFNTAQSDFLILPDTPSPTQPRVDLDSTDKSLEESKERARSGDAPALLLTPTIDGILQHAAIADYAAPQPNRTPALVQPITTTNPLVDMSRFIYDTLGSVRMPDRRLNAPNMLDISSDSSDDDNGSDADESALEHKQPDTNADLRNTVARINPPAPLSFRVNYNIDQGLPSQRAPTTDRYIPPTTPLTFRVNFMIDQALASQRTTAMPAVSTATLVSPTAASTQLPVSPPPINVRRHDISSDSEDDD